MSTRIKSSSTLLAITCNALPLPRSQADETSTVPQASVKLPWIRIAQEGTAESIQRLAATHPDIRLYRMIALAQRLEVNDGTDNLLHMITVRSTDSAENATIKREINALLTDIKSYPLSQEIQEHAAEVIRQLLQYLPLRLNITTLSPRMLAICRIIETCANILMPDLPGLAAALGPHSMWQLEAVRIFALANQAKIDDAWEQLSGPWCFNCVVVGGGPAGLGSAINVQMALTALKTQSMVTVIEKRQEATRPNLVTLLPFGRLVLDRLKLDKGFSVYERLHITNPPCNERVSIGALEGWMQKRAEQLGATVRRGHPIPYIVEAVGPKSGKRAKAAQLRWRKDGQDFAVKADLVILAMGAAAAKPGQRDPLLQGFSYVEFGVFDRELAAVGYLPHSCETRELEAPHGLATGCGRVNNWANFFSGATAPAPGEDGMQHKVMVHVGVPATSTPRATAEEELERLKPVLQRNALGNAYFERVSLVDITPRKAQQMVHSDAPVVWIGDVGAVPHPYNGLGMNTAILGLNSQDRLLRLLATAKVAEHLGLDNVASLRDLAFEHYSRKMQCLANQVTAEALATSVIFGRKDRPLSTETEVEAELDPTNG